ncbi:MAG: TIGR02186 family protein [Proteobacteria bacterium]|nr:TIGR02186 family protein [Pseudomonadota bacterium]
MSAPAARALLAAIWLGLAVSVPRAEGIILALSTREVAITSTYTGAEITVFGLIERDAQTTPRAGGYDIVASVRGPTGEVVVQRKEKYGPVWLTENRRRYAKVPLFFSTLSTKPLALVTDEETRSRLKLGLEFYLPTAAPGSDEFGFRNALLRLRREERALIDDDKAITMIRPDLFTAKITLPATAPTGLYVVDLSVLAEGVPLRTAQGGFVVRKVGFDAFVANTARFSPWTYALFTVAMAILLGWIANAVFRKD